MIPLLVLFAFLLALAALAGLWELGAAWLGFSRRQRDARRRAGR